MVAQTGEELQRALRVRQRHHKGQPGEPANCCTYDQVYRHIIELLNATSKADPELSRAYVDELEVSMCRDWSLDRLSAESSQ